MDLTSKRTATSAPSSSDKAEIRIADATVKAIVATSNTDTTHTNEDALTVDDGINLGLDPVEKAAYVWTDDPKFTIRVGSTPSRPAGVVPAGRLSAPCRRGRSITTNGPAVS
ncbi:hypothetical protein IQ62_43995 [Streptomyces scabiei]|uniref:hypothetical protein n=1 Tax=Streptomyces scabiei TaxID=1930 RepID=UPI0004E624EA|nr:hypothetical protein [Streptomyces scabiei]KFF95059.1 hypothetical protein IQ62_43995 [Streptomyces scabiei]